MTDNLINSCKRINVSSKRQITIPQTFFKALEIENEVECIFKENELVIRPIKSNDNSYFSEEILAELIKEGYSGKKLLKEFKNRQIKVKASIKNMLEEADAASRKETKYMTMEDVFGNSK